MRVTAGALLKISPFRLQSAAVNAAVTHGFISSCLWRVKHRRRRHLQCSLQQHSRHYVHFRHFRQTLDGIFLTRSTLGIIAIDLRRLGESGFCHVMFAAAAILWSNFSPRFLLSFLTLLEFFPWCIPVKNRQRKHLNKHPNTYQLVLCGCVISKWIDLGASVEETIYHLSSFMVIYKSVKCGLRAHFITRSP